MPGYPKDDCEFRADAVEKNMIISHGSHELAFSKVVRGDPMTTALLRLSGRELAEISGPFQHYPSYWPPNKDTDVLTSTHWNHWRLCLRAAALTIMLNSSSITSSAYLAESAVPNPMLMTDAVGSLVRPAEITIFRGINARCR
jgi:hypothetical protein